MVISPANGRFSIFCINRFLTQMLKPSQVPVNISHENRLPAINDEESRQNNLLFDNICWPMPLIVIFFISCEVL